MRTILLSTCLFLTSCASIPCPAVNQIPGNIPFIKITLYSRTW
ncbi:hypothetical protein [Verrucomicrobium spinosum]|nr:hypothetical protein [Verrucomicrobium spinosum]